MTAPWKNIWQVAQRRRHKGCIVSASKRAINFTKRKFLALPLAKQHKFLAAILKKQWTSPSLETVCLYNETRAWLGKGALPSTDPETISALYHHHVKLSGKKEGEHTLLPEVRRSDRCLPGSPPFSIVVYLDNLRSAHNVGSILRTVEAFSLGEVAFSKETPFIDHPQVKKTSMGTSDSVKCSKSEGINGLPRPLILMETAEGAIPLSEFRFPETFTLAIGNEEHGVSLELLKACDSIIEIPLRGRKNSLNVANAFAIAAAEIAKQLTK